MKYSKQYRERLGLTQQGLAEYLGVSKRTVEDWDQGVTDPPQPSLRLMRLHVKHSQHFIEALDWCKLHKLNAANHEHWMRALEATR